jgi:hypothetical protein
VSWKWEYVFGAEEAAKTAPKNFVKAVEKKADEIVRMCEAVYLHGRSYKGFDPKGATLAVTGGIFTYQIVVRKELVGIVQITSLHG